MNGMKDGNPITKFLIFCVSEFSAISGTTNDVSFGILDKYGVIRYLSSCYDTLHTQGKLYILADIVEMLIEKGYYTSGTKVSDVIKEFKGHFA